MKRSEASLAGFASTRRSFCLIVPCSSNVAKPFLRLPIAGKAIALMLMNTRARAFAQNATISNLDRPLR